MRQTTSRNEAIDDELGDPELRQRDECLADLQSNEGSRLSRIRAPHQGWSNSEDAPNLEYLLQVAPVRRVMHAQILIH
jgi:hypothetical protein